MFYEILKKLCKQHGITIAAFARDAGFSAGSPSSWQRGSVPTATALVKAANFFGVSTDYLLGLDDLPSRREPFDFTSEEIALIEALRHADPRSRKFALASMNAILNAQNVEGYPDSKK